MSEHLQDLLGLQLALLTLTLPAGVGRTTTLFRGQGCGVLAAVSSVASLRRVCIVTIVLNIAFRRLYSVFCNGIARTIHSRVDQIQYLIFKIHRIFSGNYVD